MKKKIILGVLLILLSIETLGFGAFEIPYPDEKGCFIGKPMTYRITADSGGQNIGAEGTFIFGQGRIKMDGKDYYDCTFESPSGVSHFYLGLDPSKKALIQKGFQVGNSNLTMDPAVKAIRYPLVVGQSWEELRVKITAENIEIPNFGPLKSLEVKEARVETKVYSETTTVPAGTFDTLRVEATYSGKIMGEIPITLVQRTWLSEDNIPVKRGFEFIFFSSHLPLYEIELSSLTPTPWDVNWDGEVDIMDVVIVARNFDQRIMKVRLPNPDVNRDGVVDILDLREVGSRLGKKS